MTIALVILLTIALGLIHYIAKRHYTFWERHGIKCLNEPSYFGAIKGSFLGFSEVMYTFAPGEPYIGITRATSIAVSIRDPEMIKHALAKDFNHFHDRGVTFDEKLDPLSLNLFSLEGKRWKILRAKLTPTFTSGKLRAMFPLVKQCIDQMVTIVSNFADKCEAVEMNEVFSRCTTDIILSCAFGLQGNSQKDPEDIYLQMVKKTFAFTKAGLMRQILITTFPRLAKILPLRKERREATDFFLNVFDATVKERERSGVKRNDFLDLLLEIKKNGYLADDHSTDNDASDQSIVFTNELMAAQAWIFFIAGSETSSSTSSFALVEIANNLPIQDKLRKEIDESIERHGGLTYEGVMEMQYLDQVVSETLRKYSPAAVLFRRITEPYTMSDGRVILPKGTRIFIHVKGLHHDPKYYPEPEKFDPERFTPEAKHNRHKYVYLPFGEGPRICIGMRFGLLQVKLALAALLSQFEFRPKPGVPYPPVLSKNKSLVTSFEHGSLVLISKRNTETK